MNSRNIKSKKDEIKLEFPNIQEILYNEETETVAIVNALLETSSSLPTAKANNYTNNIIMQQPNNNIPNTTESKLFNISSTNTIQSKCKEIELGNGHALSSSEKQFKCKKRPKKFNNKSKVRVSGNDKFVKPCVEKSINSYQNAHKANGSAGSNIKTSLSMTSLATDEKRDNRNVFTTKLKMERPYNSLKKCTTEENGKSSSDNKNRFSWGSINSYSSSSLHSGTTLGISSCKDDLWSAIQTNYNYIMDTNLLDSCKEARCEIEGATNVLESPVKYYTKMLDESNQCYDLCGDLKELRKWLRDMEQKLENAPTISEATSFSINELQRFLTQHSVLYHEIVSHARVVSSCIRVATEKEQQQLQQQQCSIESSSTLTAKHKISFHSFADETIISGETQSNSSGIGSYVEDISPLETSLKISLATDTSVASNSAALSSEENFERLQNRYHLLYLKAFEVQLCLDGLLRKKTSRAKIEIDNNVDELRKEKPDLNEEKSIECCCGTTEDDLNNVASDFDNTSNSSIIQEPNKYFSPTHSKRYDLPTFQQEVKTEHNDGDDEQEDDEDEFSLKFKRHWMGFRSSNKVNLGSKANSKYISKESQKTAQTDFDADSESSDYEIVRKIYNNFKFNYNQHLNTLWQRKSNGSKIAHRMQLLSNTSIPYNKFDRFEHIIIRSSKNKQINCGKTKTLHSTTKKPTLRHTKMKVLKSSANTKNISKQSSTKVLQTVETLHNNTFKETMSSHKKQLVAFKSTKQNNVGGISSNRHNTSKKSQNVLRKHLQLKQFQQQRHIDLSKFNRSNRKSKNCAIFYFKHLDSDNETNHDGNDADKADTITDDGDNYGDADCNSQTLVPHVSNVFKFADASSDDDEGWFYSSSTLTEKQHQHVEYTDIIAQEGSTAAIKAIKFPLSGSKQKSVIFSADSDKDNNKQVILESPPSTNMSTIISTAVTGICHIPIDADKADLNTTSSSAISTVISSSSSSSSSSEEIGKEKCINKNNNTGISNNDHTYSSNSNLITNNNALTNLFNNNKSINLKDVSDCVTMRSSQQNQNGLKSYIYSHKNIEEQDTILNNKGCFLSCSDDNMKIGESMNAKNSHVNIFNMFATSSSAKSTMSDGSSSTATLYSNKGKITQESIKQLVLDVENLVRDEALKTPSKPKHSIVTISSTVKKKHLSMPRPIKKRVEEWLDHQPSSAAVINKTTDTQHKADDCEASGETSETDSISQPGSDTSEEFSDSVATCMQTSTNSYGNSTEHIGGLEEPFSATNAVCSSSYQSLNINVIKRQQTHRKSERPWSVSCLSQLTTDAAQSCVKQNTACEVQAGLASYSISESALDSLSPGRVQPIDEASSAVVSTTKVRKVDSKGSLKRRKTRKKKLSSFEKRTDSGSEKHVKNSCIGQKLFMTSCESMTVQQIQENPTHVVSTNLQKLFESEDEQELMKPNFRVGLFTTAYMTEARLGSLATLATSMYDQEQQADYTTGTEDHHSSFSETAWDNYQEKYNSENYSEGFDSDAARRLMEFGDDYRNFIDSQSDCCSSVSAANNLDSLSPPRMDSLQSNETKIITQDTIVKSVDHAKRQRGLELEYERRRKTLEVRGNSFQDLNDQQQQKPHSLAYSLNVLTPKLSQDKFNYQTQRRTSESDTSIRRRKNADERRRSSRTLERCKLFPSSATSSFYNDSDDEKELRYLLQQSRNRLDDTNALKIRFHLLRPEDYTEIINTCRDNIRCLESVLSGPSATVLSAHCVSQTKELLSIWEDLLNWSENAEAARKLQEEMHILKQSLHRLADQSKFQLLDTEPAIKIAIETLKNEKSQLQSYRSSMLRLNSSVHSWLTRQEHKLQTDHQHHETAVKIDLESAKTSKEAKSELSNEQFAVSSEPQLNNIILTNNNSQSLITETASTMINEETLTDTFSDINKLNISENEFHKYLKSDVGDMYSAWDDADMRINKHLEILTTSLTAWRQLEYGLSEFHYALGQDRGTLKGLEGALNKGQPTAVELAQNVKLVAKLLSDKINVSQAQLTAAQEHLDPNHILHIAKYAASTGSLSDSGISDGGTTSDGGLSERERRLGVLRRLAKQLEYALAPGSEAMKSIAARMESAEAELKNLQNTCRDLIVRTAETHQHKKQQQTGIIISEKSKSSCSEPTSCIKNDRSVSIKNSTCEKHDIKHKKKSSESRKKLKIEENLEIVTSSTSEKLSADRCPTVVSYIIKDKNGQYNNTSFEFCDEQSRKRSWAWRFAKVAVPMQLALITFFCAACMMQPNCCDNLNNFSMSFSPHLRYIRGPPPI